MNTQPWQSALMQDIKILSQNPKLNLDANKFQVVHANINHEILDTAQLLNMIQKMTVVTGWVQATSEVQTLTSEPIKVSSTLLSGEWITVDNNTGTKTSYLLEYIGNYQWSLQSCQLDFDQNKQPTHIAERVTYREVGARNKRSLVYQKLWTQKNATPAANMVFFTGFDG